MGSNKVDDVRPRSAMSQASIPITVADHGKGSMRLYSFTTSIAEEKEAIQSLLDSKQSHLSQMGKMLLVIAIPVVSQLALSILNLSRATTIRFQVADAQRGIDTFFLIDDLVTNLQVERGTTATYLSSSGADRNAFSRLVNIRLDTDKVLDRLQDWPTGGLRIGHMAFDSKVDLKGYLDAFRIEVNEILVEFEPNMKFFTEITTALMDWGQQAVVLPEKGNMWPLLVAKTSLMQASDAIGIQRALGATFITVCGVDSGVLTWFTALKGEVQACLSFAFGYHNTIRLMYEDKFVGSHLEEKILNRDNMISDPAFTAICYNFTDEERFNSSLLWFADMTDYMDIMKDIRTMVSVDILTLLREVTSSQQVEVIIYSMIVAIVTAVCFSLTFWYSAKLHKMVSKITSYAKKMSAKSAELASEKKRSEALLYQMLPRAVADQLRVNKQVKAEYYGQVTIMFSDIVGFTNLCAVSSPLQVVDMLNILYSVFDASIDRYDVYKVETIGDTYMVVAGVPTPIEHHAVEMAHLTLELLVTIQDVKVPHMQGWKLQMRVGLHTGSCVAGVVGVKMPRYCLFGDTVNTASRMESSGVANKIHISETTKETLEAHGGFVIEQRGTVDIKGKGDMMTYFVTGCAGAPCHHKMNPIDGSQPRRASASTPHSHKALSFKN